MMNGQTVTHITAYRHSDKLVKPKNALSRQGVSELGRLLNWLRFSSPVFSCFCFSVQTLQSPCNGIFHSCNALLQLGRETFHIDLRSSYLPLILHLPYYKINIY